MLDDDVQVAGATDAGGLQIFHLANDQHRGAHDARGARHIGHRQRDHDAAGLGAERGTDADGKQDRRERHQRVHQPHHIGIQGAEIAGGDTNQGADRTGDQRHGKSDRQRQPAAIKHAGEDIASILIAAERKTRRRRLEAITDAHRGGIGSAQPWTDHRAEHEHHDQHQPDLERAMRGKLAQHTEAAALRQDLNRGCCQGRVSHNAPADRPACRGYRRRY